MSKVEVKQSKPLKFELRTNDFLCSHPLNPLDVMFSHQVLSYDTVNMPPVSLIRNVRIHGQFYELEGGLKLPAQMQYHSSG